MCGQKDGGATLRLFLDCAADLRRCDRVQAVGRFVQKQDTWLIDEGARDHHPLAHTL
jgi:hypothetical protein